MKILKEDIKLQNKTKIKQQIKVKNFRIFHNSYTIDLEKPNVAHQKISNFLSTCLTENVTVAVNNEGGFKEAMLPNANPEKDYIEFEIKWRRSKPGQKIFYLIYILKIGCKQGKVFIAKETLTVRYGYKGMLAYVLNYSMGSGYISKNGYVQNIFEEREEVALEADDILALKVLGQIECYQNIKFFKNIFNSYLSNLKNK
ncbi:MAG: hypothetical protein KAH77_08235 [Thiomargarita sp.]|nr:hypothetical protein [Thiomargarita sp.]